MPNPIRKLKPRPEVYDTYWQTAAERQNIFFRRLNGQAPPYSNDPVFQTYKFCNVYRASDRVSQFLIRNVIYSQVLPAPDTLFRIFLFRLFNKISTWQKLERQLGQISLSNFDFELYDQTLTDMRNETGPIYGNAFILCANKAFGYERKHPNHLALLKQVFQTSSTHKELLQADSLKQLFTQLRALPLMGDFMAYQLAIDFNYSPLFDFSENDFTIAGPGAKRGITKCFVDTASLSDSDIIKYMVDHQQEEFARLNLNWHDLWGRPLTAIDCQNWFCETDKYCRVSFPHLKSNRQRIKTKFQPTSKPIEYFYPPKWRLTPVSRLESAHAE